VSMTVELMRVSQRALDALKTDARLLWPVARFDSERAQQASDYTSVLQSSLSEVVGQSSNDTNHEDLDTELLVNAGLSPADFEGWEIVCNCRLVESALPHYPALSAALTGARNSRNSMTTTSATTACGTTRLNKYGRFSEASRSCSAIG
jgi:hypothetical protein